MAKIDNLPASPALAVMVFQLARALYNDTPKDDEIELNKLAVMAQTQRIRYKYYTRG